MTDNDTASTTGTDRYIFSFIMIFLLRASKYGQFDIYLLVYENIIQFEFILFRYYVGERGVSNDLKVC